RAGIPQTRPAGASARAPPAPAPADPGARRPRALGSTDVVRARSRADNSRRGGLQPDSATYDVLPGERDHVSTHAAMRLRLYHHPDGARVAYRELGAGPPLALLHSGLLSHRAWEPAVAP